MEVVCPSCSSRFNLPDSVKPGAKLRCSVCKHIFRLEISTVQEDPAPSTVSAAAPETPTPAAPVPETPPVSATASQKQQDPLISQETMDMDFTMAAPVRSRGKLKKLLFFFLILLLLGGAGIGGWWLYFNILHPPVPVPEEQARKLAKLSMEGVRQYTVDNDTIGKIFVVTGYVVNGFTEAKDLIELEISLYGKNRKIVQSQRILAGTTVSHFQLGVLSEKELDTLLSNKIEILSNNTNVGSGARVPFMALFYAPKATVTEFGVRIVDVQDSVPPTSVAPATPENKPATDEGKVEQSSTPEKATAPAK